MYKLYDSTRKNKKYMIITPDNKKVHFGASGYEDYTIHKDDQRKKSYIARHQHNEDWTENGTNTAGFWSRWLLWNKKTIIASIDDIYDRFGINIEYDVHHENV